MQKEHDRQRRINVILDKETHKRLRIESVELDQPMNMIARNVLSQHFSKEQSSDRK